MLCFLDEMQNSLTGLMCLSRLFLVHMIPCSSHHAGVLSFSEREEDSLSLIQLLLDWKEREIFTNKTTQCVHTGLPEVINALCVEGRGLVVQLHPAKTVQLCCKLPRTA